MKEIPTPKTDALRAKFNSTPNVECDDVLDAQDLAEEFERENILLREVFKAASKGQDDYKNYHPSLYQIDASDGDSRAERLKKNIENLERALVAAKEGGIAL